MLHMGQFLEAADAAITAALDLRAQAGRRESAFPLPRRRERHRRSEEERERSVAIVPRLAGRGRDLRRQLADDAAPVLLSRTRTLPDSGLQLRGSGGGSPGLAEALRHELQDTKPCSAISICPPKGSARSK